MLSKVFMFIINCFSEIFKVLKSFKLEGNISYFDFLIFLGFIVLLYNLFKSFKIQFDDDQKWLSNMKRYDEYISYQRKLKSYDKNKRGDN
jgi:hypothetical protein